MTLLESNWKESNRPRVYVSWYEAVAFCRWLSTRTGLDIHLPSEPAWEKAARGTDGREYPWGNGYQAGTANVNEKVAEQGSNYLGHPCAVGLFVQAGSPYGIMDMAGNSWEWCQNKFDDPASISLDESNDPRVLRGGSWDLVPEVARSASRYRYNPDLQFHDIGFRIVRSSPTLETDTSHAAL